DIESVPTARAEDGLALSSRNSYLGPKHRKIAPVLHQTLLETKDKLLSSKITVKDIQKIEKQAVADLKEAGFKPQYVEVRDAKTLTPVQKDSEEAVILAAASLGKTRLIDNVTTELDSAQA
ncbi:MAG: pantoate--beta-alanine ligase, partial [Pseudomonadales bacterium]